MVTVVRQRQPGYAWIVRGGGFGEPDCGAWPRQSGERCNGPSRIQLVGLDMTFPAGVGALSDSGMRSLCPSPFSNFVRQSGCSSETLSCGFSSVLTCFPHVAYSRRIHWYLKLAVLVTRVGLTHSLSLFSLHALTNLNHFGGYDRLTKQATIISWLGCSY